MRLEDFDYFCEGVFAQSAFSETKKKEPQKRNNITN